MNLSRFTIRELSHECITASFVDRVGFERTDKTAIVKVLGVELRGRYSADHVADLRRAFELFLTEYKQTFEPPPVHAWECGTCGFINEVRA